jgi:hypothetical protein
MSKWSVIETEHLPPQVIPSDENGRPLPPHTIYGACKCGPALDSSGEREVLVHKDIDRGGGNVLLTGGESVQ